MAPHGGLPCRNGLRSRKWPRFLTSGDDRARTDNPRLAKPVLSQLSYVPESEQGTASREQNVQNCSLIAIPCSTEVGVPGLEPGTSALSELRSNQLSYTP